MNNPVKQDAEIQRLRALLDETLIRCQLVFPASEQEIMWFDAGHDITTDDGRDYFNRITKFRHDRR